MHFTSSSVFLKEHTTKLLFAEGFRRGRLYLIEDLTQRFPTFASFFAIEDEQYDILWHHRLGHCSLESFKSLCSVGLIALNKFSDCNNACNACQLGKQS